MTILAYLESRPDGLKKTAFEVATASCTLAAESGGAKIIALTIGAGAPANLSSLGEFGISDVVTATDPRLANYSSAYARILADVATAEGADIVLLAASSLGKDLAPRIAIRLEAGLSPDTAALKVEGSTIIATRPVFAGKAFIDVELLTEKKVFSLRPNVFSRKKAEQAVTVTPRAANVTLTDNDFAMKVREVVTSEGKLDVAEADVICTGGRGFKGPENFYLLEDLARALNGAVGASRAVVDAGWRPHAEQVGQTGKTVSPSLYIACAVSGAVQHLAGMSSSKIIVAINKDKDAPIFSIADYGIIGDVFEILPALTEEIKKLKAEHH